MQKIKCGLIGCGRISNKHVSVIKSLSELLDLVAVCDIDKERALKLARESGATPYYDYKKLLANEELDLVSILTWSGNHASIALDCIGLIPNIIVEKPMALKLSDADKMIEECAKTHTRLFVVKQNRYNPPVVALRKAVDQGRFGKIILGTIRVRWARYPEYYLQDKWRGTWEWDGGVFTNQASHHLDLLTWLLGPIESVFAKTDTFLSPKETEDTGVVVVKFVNGALGVLEATTCARPKDLEGSISILGEKGSVEIAGFAVNQIRTWQFVEPMSEDEQVFDLSNNPPNVYGFGHLDFYKDVVNCIVEGKKSMIDGIEGKRSLELINAIYESVETGREVFLRFRPQKCRLGEKQIVNQKLNNGYFNT